jgi:AcrR family transcriptional regulator
MRTDRQHNAREQVLKAASRLFYQEGIHVVGVDRIAAEAGITKRSLYYHFASKDELIAEYLSSPAPQLSIEEMSEQPGQQILAAFNALDSWFRKGSFRGCRMINASAEFAGKKHAVRKIARDQKQARLDWFQKAAGQAGVRDAPRLASQLMMLFDGAICAALVRQDLEAGRDARAAAETLLRQAGAHERLG